MGFDSGKGFSGFSVLHNNPSSNLVINFTFLNPFASPNTMGQNAVNNQDLVEDIIEKLKEENIDSVRFEYCDINAVARSKTIPSRHFKSKVNYGLLFPICCLTIDPKGGMVNDHIIERYLWSDMVCYPDLSTFTVLPWMQKTARVFVTPLSVGDGDQVKIDPRTIAMTQIKALLKKKIKLLSSLEYELWLVDEITRKPVNTDINIFSTIRLSKYQDFFNKVSRNLFTVGVDIECIESEYAKGQFELPMEPAFGVQAGDNAVTFRTGIKEMALQEGLMASFMTKPYEDADGASGHFNHSLWSLDGKTSLLADTSRPSGLSEIGEYWIAGILAHVPALSVLQAPTLNCRDRNKPGTFAPFNATWGYDNRTCAVRLKGNTEQGFYIENRLGSSAGNPYINLAATIAAGIDGINRQLLLPKALPLNKSSDDEGIIPPGTVLIPTDGEDALQALLSDEPLVKALGSEFVKTFEAIRRHEMKLMDDYTKSGANKVKWARELYFEYI
ncbi:Lengsin [Holothuria leucospilota]|uniref:Lengsin n=1 Tax=Holothuria leucospilota TaxID=206669 RepID=A0A9Q1H252_HOLLE|nr:Lengsin [Holothuria leucospilota]